HKDDRLVRLAHIAPKKGATFLYEYDFGDCWKHEVTVEDISPTPKDEPPYPWCLDGQRACPPEDVGGVSGYANFLEAWRKRSHPEHQEMHNGWGSIFSQNCFRCSRSTLRWPCSSLSIASPNKRPDQSACPSRPRASR